MVDASWDSSMALEMMPEDDRVTRAWGLGVALVVIGAMLYPLVPNRDSYPLSNYPMFSTNKPSQAKVFHVVGFSSQGRHRPIEPDFLGTDEVMQAFQTVRLAARGGRDRSEALCRRVASELTTHEAYRDLTHLEVRIDHFDTIAYWKGDRTPSETRVIARCPVEHEEDS